MKRNIIILAALLCGVGIGLGIGTADLPTASAQSGIANPQALRFVNERIRPLAEELRALNLECQDILAVWNGGMNSLFPNDTTAIDDGREAEGVSRLRGQDIHNMMTLVDQLNTRFTAAGVQTVIQKPCVRRLEVN